MWKTLKQQGWAGKMLNIETLGFCFDNLEPSSQILK